MDLRALTPSDPVVLRDIELRRWRAAFGDVTAIADLVPRQPGTCVGVVHRIRLVPRTSLEVTVEDGSGRLTAVWSGRTRLPGLELGGGMRLTGTVSEGVDGELRMRNPAWTPISEPYS